MPAHDGPISEGIRDAIQASLMTPYAIAKEVTKGGKVRLTGPQIYRFLNNKKGLSLAILDEIALVLGLAIKVLPPEERRSRNSPYRSIFQERLDKMAALAVDVSLGFDERITALDRAYNSLYRENLWTPGEIAVLFDRLNTLKNQVRREASRKNPPPSTAVFRRSARSRPKTEPAVDDVGVDGDDDDGPRYFLGSQQSEPEPEYIDIFEEQEQAAREEAERARTLPPRGPFRIELPRPSPEFFAKFKDLLEPEGPQGDGDSPRGPGPSA